MLPEIILWLRIHSVLALCTVFTLIVIVTYWPGRGASIERNGLIPLDDDR
jgi:hypothetical protein